MDPNYLWLCHVFLFYFKSRKLITSFKRLTYSFFVKLFSQFYQYSLLSILVSEHIFEKSFLKHDKVPSIHSDVFLRGQISGISCLLFTKHAKFFFAYMDMISLSFYPQKWSRWFFHIGHGVLKKMIVFRHQFSILSLPFTAARLVGVSTYV